MNPLSDYREVWLVDFQFDKAAGEPPQPFGLAAEELHGGRRLRLGQDELHRPEPPYATDARVLFVTYDAAAALGCHLTLGWPMPERILDLQAEFRWLTSGLDVPGGYDLAGALNHFGLTGEGVEGLGKPLEAMLPHLDLSRALLRGRYMTAVARMEAVGVPIDVARLARLRDGWEPVQDALIEQVDRAYGVYHGRQFRPRLWSAWCNRYGIPWPRLASRKLDLRQETFRDMAVAYPAVQPMQALRAALSQMRMFRLAVGADGRNRCPLRPFASKTGRNQPSTAQFIFGPATWLRGLIRPAEGMALAYVDYEQQEFGIAAALSADPAMMEAYRSGDPYLTFARQAGAVPADATKASHREERERFKTCAWESSMGCRRGAWPSASV